MKWSVDSWFFSLHCCCCLLFMSFQCLGECFAFVTIKRSSLMEVKTRCCSCASSKWNISYNLHQLRLVGESFRGILHPLSSTPKHEIHSFQTLTALEELSCILIRYLTLFSLSFVRNLCIYICECFHYEIALRIPNYSIGMETAAIKIIVYGNWLKAKTIKFVVEMYQNRHNCRRLIK